jgi:hypothetical protein
MGNDKLFPKIIIYFWGRKSLVFKWDLKTQIARLGLLSLKRNHIWPTRRKSKYSLGIGLWVGLQFDTNHFAHLDIHMLVAFGRACITSCDVCDCPNWIGVDTTIVLVASSEKSNRSHNSPAIGTAAQSHIIHKKNNYENCMFTYHQLFLWIYIV